MGGGFSRIAPASGDVEMQQNAGGGGGGGAGGGGVGGGAGGGGGGPPGDDDYDINTLKRRLVLAMTVSVLTFIGLKFYARNSKPPHVTAEPPMLPPLPAPMLPPMPLPKP